MERKDMDRLIKKAMAIEAMGMEEPDASLVSAARCQVVARKKQPEKQSGLLANLLLFTRHRLRFYQVGFSVLLTCLCLVFAFDMNVDNHGGHDLVNYNPDVLSIKNTTISVNSSTILTSIPTLRN